jgi:glycoprotein 6-alpha-L-fucosyltransferase
MGTWYYNPLSYFSSILSDWRILSKFDGYGNWRDQEAKRLSNIVQKRFQRAMNPPNCSKAKYFRCHGEYDCGWGCQMSGYVNCFSVAFGLGRVLDFYKTATMYYEQDEYQRYYLPTTTCNASQLLDKIVDWPGTENSTIINAPVQLRRFSPRIRYNLLTMPADLAPQILRVFEEPSAWWSSEINKFLFKPKPETEKMFAAAVDRLQFKKPIVGVHIRRGNKNSEADYQPVELYMEAVNGFYDQLELTEKVEQRRIYLLTDEPKVIEEIRKNYKNYEVIVNEAVSKKASDYHHHGLSAEGVMVDVHLASVSDFFVGTFSSNVGRRIYEFMYNQYMDAHERVFSLDNRYFEFGENTQRFKVLIDHKPIASNELAAVAGDLLEMNGGSILQILDFRGEMPMANLNSSKTGWFPSFKVEKIFDVTDFPNYGVY